jgi:ectoine hydroxylase-related dioxygenase (phytanoyl-CoA dioxygenase family)
MNYVNDVASHGFAVLENVVDSETVSVLLQEVAKARTDNLESQREGKAFGIRNLLNVVPFTRELANNSACKSIVEPILGSTARVVRGIYFDKHKDANWKVAWHQDLTIAVKERIKVSGYGPWSIKAGIHHVQPPESVLKNMLTVRIHLDHTEEINGALRVLPGTHQYGRLDTRQFEYWKQHVPPVTCSVRRGGAMIMKPLLLHSSTTAIRPEHRRVLHFEYSSIDLPGGLRWFEEDETT